MKNEENVKRSIRQTVIQCRLFLVAFLLVIFWSPLLREAKAMNFGPDLIGRWEFNESSGTTAFDSSGNGNNAGLSGGVEFSTDAVRGGVVDFTSATGAIAVPNNPELDPATGAFAAWVNIDQPGNYDIMSKTTNKFLRRGLTGGFSVLGLRITDDGTVNGFVGNDDPTASGSWTVASSSAGLITPGIWNELAFRWDGATVDLFVNDILAASSPYDPIPGIGLSYNVTSPLNLGTPTSWGFVPDDFDGKMDDVRFWNVQPVPEPSTMIILGSGLIGLLGYNYRHRKRA